MTEVANIPLKRTENGHIAHASIMTLNEVMSSLANAVDSLQSLQDSETNQAFRNLEVNFQKDGIDLYKATRLFEINLIRQALRITNGHQANAARLLNLRTSTLNSIIKRHDINY